MEIIKVLLNLTVLSLRGDPLCACSYIGFFFLLIFVNLIYSLPFDSKPMGGTVDVKHLYIL